MRLSKQQKNYQEKILLIYGLNKEFKTSVALIEHLAFTLNHERSRNIWSIIGERVRRALKSEAAK